MDLSQHRKITTLIISGVVVFTLYKAFGLKVTELSQFGMSLSGIVEPMVEIILLYGIPAIFVEAQPNTPGATILTWWKRIVVGLAVVGAIVLFFWLVLG